jgi:aldehyde reductase
MTCIRKSLKRLQLDYVDLYLMHWPGPAYKNTYKNRKRRIDDGTVEANDRWNTAIWNNSLVANEDEMTNVRAETWRAMEDCVRNGLTRSIGVSNMTIQHLKKLKESATMWPPGVNQVEFQ